MSRETKGHPNQAAEAALEGLKKRFEEWRRTRGSRRCPIPSDLLSSAQGLVGSYRAGPLAKRLRLHYGRLAKRPSEGPRPKRGNGVFPAQSGPTFVKFPLEAPRTVFPRKLESPAVVEFENPGGYKARIFLGRAPLSLVCRLLQSIGGEAR